MKMDNEEEMIQKIIKMLKKAEEDRKADREERKAFQEKMDAFHEKRMTMLEEQEKRMIACFGQTEARLEYEEAASGNINNDRNETTADNEATEKIEKNRGMMQSIEEHQDVPNEDVAVVPVNGLRKRRRGRKSTAGRRGEPKELTRGNCGSRKKLAGACRKVSRHARVAWCKRNLMRRHGNQEYCESWRIFAAAGKGMDRCAGVARRGVQDGKRYVKVNEGQAIKKRRKDGNRLWKHPECNSSIWNAFLRHQIQDPDRCQQLRRRMEHTSDGIDVKIFRLENEMPTAESFMALRKMKKWSVWKVRPPPKRKK
jgi:hypothetical protein